MPYLAQSGPLGDDQAEQFIPLLEGGHQDGAGEPLPLAGQDLGGGQQVVTLAVKPDAGIGLEAALAHQIIGQGRQLGRRLRHQLAAMIGKRRLWLLVGIIEGYQIPPRVSKVRTLRLAAR